MLIKLHLYVFNYIGEIVINQTKIPHIESKLIVWVNPKNRV
jgi:hypothetical protein